jgi:hypothetical protein
MSIKQTVDDLARTSGAAPAVDRSARVLTDGTPVTADYAELKADGQQKDYVVLSEAERARGFVRPVRRTYLHVGPPGPKHPLRELTPDELTRYADVGYVKYERYPSDPKSSTLGRFWTQAQLDRVGKGCGSITTMGAAIAKTYARDPHFYGGTFCCGCGAHFPVGRDGEFVWDGTDERVGT